MDKQNEDSFQRQLRRFDLKNWKTPLEESLLFPAILQAVNGPYTKMSRFKGGSKSNVKHRQTCPVCGKKLVNLYFRGDEWKCFKCFEEGKQDA
jgi:hypothetical protein